MSLSLESADRLMERLILKLAPACDRIEPAGSVRRRRPVVKDLEIVAISKLRKCSEADTLFTTREWAELEVWHSLEELRIEAKVKPISPGKSAVTELAIGREDPLWQSKRTGAKYLRFYVPLAEAMVDLFLVTPETWGALYTIRTGSSDFSQALVEHWTLMSTGGRVKEGRLYPLEGFGPCVPYETPEEEDVFTLCGLSCIRPEERSNLPEGWAKSPENRRRLLKLTGAL